MELPLKKAESFPNDREVVLLAVQENGLELEFASPELQNDEEVVSLALKNNPKVVLLFLGLWHIGNIVENISSHDLDLFWP